MKRFDIAVKPVVTLAGHRPPRYGQMQFYRVTQGEHTNIPASRRTTKVFFVLIISFLILLGMTRITLAEEHLVSSVGFIEMPESVNNEWILNSPYGSEKAWGRPEMIRHLTLVCREWNRRYPDRPKIRIGDISKPNGGVFAPHNTHQVGLAVDIKTRPVNIVDVEYEAQQQTIELAELFYTFGASWIIYGRTREFDGFPVIASDQGHNTHFHVVINPDNVPDSDDWVIMPKLTLAGHKNLRQTPEIIDILVSCDLVGIIKENDQWKTVLPKELSDITFLLEDVHNSRNSSLTFGGLVPQSATIEKQIALETNHQYRWRIIITTSLQQKLQSKWFLIDTASSDQPEPVLRIFDTDDKLNLPVHFTVLTRNPDASHRITSNYLENELQKLNAECAMADINTIFSLKSVCNIDTVAKSRTRLSHLIDAPKPYNKEQWRMFVNTCLNSGIVNPSAINVFVFDAYSTKNKFSSKSVWIQRNFNRPYIFLDWQRSLNYELVKFITEEPNIVSRYLAENPRLLKNEIVSSQNVEPLLKTQWAQRGLYAQYTPSHQRLGCWSVAFAQILYHHRINPSGKVKYEGDGYRIDETLDYQFNWDHFEKSLTPTSLNEVQSEVARYCYYTAIAIQKEFVDGEAYKGNSDLRREGIKKHFRCNTRRYRSDKHSDQKIQEVILAELAAGRPLLLYVEGKGGLGHAFVIDGVRVHKKRIAVHLNCGWEGSDDGWYPFDRPFKTSRGLFNNPNRWILAICPEKKEDSKKVNGND